MLNKTKIYIIDFEDSFTFNIATELYIFEKNIQVVSHQDFFSSEQFTNFVGNIKKPTAVILGPGPGSPEEYRKYFLFIKKLKEERLIFLLGICLGHQIISLLDGMFVKPSSTPIHGGQVKIIFENKSILVQRYNSLAVFKSMKGKKEIQLRQWERGASYQFHPESIGTENNALFFKDLLTFVQSS